MMSSAWEDQTEVNIWILNWPEIVREMTTVR